MATNAQNDSKLAAVRKKKAQKLTGAQKDKIQEIKDKRLDSVPEKVKAGLLDPSDFDIRDIEALRPKAAETERIAEVIEALLNEHYSRGGLYKWTVGFFLPGDPATAGAGGWKVLLAEMIRPHWTNEFKSTVGLHEYEGAVCWAGRGRMDRHVLCVMTTKLRDELRALSDKRTMEQFQQIEAPPGSKGVEITEKVIKGKLGYDQGAALDDTGVQPIEAEAE